MGLRCGPLQQSEEGSGMAKKGYSEEQILRALRQAESGAKVSVPGRLIAESDGRRFAGNPPEAKIAWARRHHS